MGLEEKFNLNQSIFGEIQDIESSYEDVTFSGNELKKEVEKLIGIKSDSENITWDSNNEQDLSRLYEEAIRYINCLDKEKESVKQSYEKIIQLENQRKK